MRYLLGMPGGEGEKGLINDKTVRQGEERAIERRLGFLMTGALKPIRPRSPAGTEIWADE